ncbi:MAG TPA: hypothetical protein VFL95_08905 [Gemmatimonadales bacterium]|nr:hypothetical protein [Gemmatimonadales bacterium]
MALLFGLMICSVQGCDSEVGPLEPPTTLPGGGATSGQGGGASGADLLIGTWQRIALVQVDDDLQRWTTTWLFQNDSLCRRTTETLSMVEGFPRTQVEDCQWRPNGPAITVRFDQQADSVVFDYRFGTSSDQLILGGFEFQRVS